MWGFTEKEIEKYLTRPTHGRKKAVIAIGKDSYLVLWSQPRLRSPEKSERNPQPPLFKDMRGFEGFLPLVDGKVKIPDILAYRYPKSTKDLVVFELKRHRATVQHVAQLRRYMNLIRLYLDHDIDAIRMALRATPDFKVKGVLLAEFVPKDVWLASSPDMTLVAYELASDPKRRKINGIHYVNFSERYRRDRKSFGRKYCSDRRGGKGKQRSLPLQ